MTYTQESDFERDLVHLLTTQYGWEPEVLKYPSEDDLIRNWAKILFDNNRGIDRLNDAPLTDGEMAQLLDQIRELKTPLALNGFINGRTAAIKRDNPADAAHFGKEVTLKIYDRDEIAAGQSRYQIAQQPRYRAKTSILPERRGDLVLLINGMPVIHIELKKSGIPVSQASFQIEKYAHEGVFTGLFALVQVFVAMTPEESIYFANPGPDGKFNPDYFFHWADFNNEPINDWREIASRLLSIPMAHQIIGFYTVPDTGDGVLKVMRSYQYFAASRISDAVREHHWDTCEQRGGYIWHTTGSGKTLTSFKSAQLVANSKDADKLVFLVDRIELGVQSAKEYRGFVQGYETVQETEDAEVLKGKLKSNDPKDTLIVTSIQKMSVMARDENNMLKQADIDAICTKRIVFIVDECHRSTFGDMMHDIKSLFKRALFFGFTGTPIQIENTKKGCTTTDIFGSELHRYSIADGIRDKNVLGFDLYKILTFKENDMRKAVALEKAKALTEDEVFDDPKKTDIYLQYMKEVPMAGETDEQTGRYIKGIEDFMRECHQYDTMEHHKKVVEDIIENWTTLSHGNKFHAILATSNIPEAIKYYKLLKSNMAGFRITALFDPSIDNKDGCTVKEDALVEIIEDYNRMYETSFSIPTYAAMKKDIQDRLAHKGNYKRVAQNPAQRLDLLIVVDQMLTGYDSKWINVLYLDKIITYENIIQAFSRTNRLFGPEKPFGIIRYYRAPFTMARNIERAVKLYSGDRPLDIFVSKLPDNIAKLNAIFAEIKDVFGDVENFEHLPDDPAAKRKFAKLFKQYGDALEAAKIQGYVPGDETCQIQDEDSGELTLMPVAFTSIDTAALTQRYKELFYEIEEPGTPSGTAPDSPTEVPYVVKTCPYDLAGYLTTMHADEIDTEYMNSRFEKFKKALETGDPAAVEAAKAELHRTFSTLSQTDQRFASLFLHDLETGDVQVDPEKTLRDYITEYSARAQNDEIHRLATDLGLDESLLREMTCLHLNADNINEYGRFDALKASVDRTKAKAYFEQQTGKSLPMIKVNIGIDKALRGFVLRE